jgi:hypothetical protein
MTSTQPILRMTTTFLRPIKVGSNASKLRVSMDLHVGLDSEDSDNLNEQEAAPVAEVIDEEERKRYDTTLILPLHRSFTFGVSSTASERSFGRTFKRQ